MTGGEPAATRPPRFDAHSVRESRDRAADGYDAAQASGHDFYRYDFFGPAQVAMCGEVQGLRLLDVGCGSGYLARFVASITHPCTDTPFRRWERDAAGAKRWLCVDRYFDREAMEFAWIRWADPPFSTVAQHATLEDWLEWVLDAGFELRAFREPRPTAEALRARPELEDAARMPYYVMLDLERR